MTDDSKNLSKERYTRFAEGYVTSKTHAKGADLDRLVAIANPQSDWYALDIATGGGHTALKFAPHVNQVLATDITPRMLEKAREFITDSGAKNVDFAVVDAENIPYDDATFDLVTCRIAPHHFPNITQFIKESARVLKAGGLLIVQDHVLPEDKATADIVDGFEKLRDPSHNFALSHDAWMKTFEDAGLQVTHTEELTKRHEFIKWAQRQGNDDELINSLVEMVKNSTEAVQAWMAIENWGSEDATFVNHHIIIAGLKPK